MKHCLTAALVAATLTTAAPADAGSAGLDGLRAQSLGKADYQGPRPRPVARPTASYLINLTPTQQDRALSNWAKYQRSLRAWERRGNAYNDAHPLTTISKRLGGHTTSDGACYGQGCN
ncbi:MAG TPA: hypothetical protein PKA07_11320 [Micropruina sp.]|nr:hypothetical protein [Micropruina sp.]